VENLVADGWTVDKSNKKSVRLRRSKPHGALLEDRVWTLLHRMQFPILSNDGGAQLVLNPKDTESPQSQIDVVGIDVEVAVAIECKSAQNLARRPQFQHEARKARFDPRAICLVRAITIRDAAQTTNRPGHVSVEHLPIGQRRLRAKEANIFILDEHDLTYYESLTSHIGPAAKYQFWPRCYRERQCQVWLSESPRSRARWEASTAIHFRSLLNIY